MVWWCPSVRPSVRVSVRPSVRHSFPHFSPTCFEIWSWNFVYDFILMHVRSSLNTINFRQFLLELSPFWTSHSYKYAVFRIFLLHALTYGDEILQYDFVLLYYRSSLSVINLRQFLSELCPFWNLEYWKYSFPHFSLTSFDILSLNFAYDFVLLYYRSSSSVVNFCGSYAPFGTKNTENTVFRTFLLQALMYWAEILHITLFYCTTDQVRVSSIFVGVMPLLELTILKIHSFPHFSLTCFDILSWNFSYDFV